MPVFGLVDVNSFFCSCEELLNPKLKGRPGVVLSNNDGMAVARNKLAKALGIGLDPFHLNKKRWDELGVYYRSSNYPFYNEMTGRVMAVLENYAPKIEVYSCDEAFLDLNGIPNLDAHAREIKQVLLQYCGLPVGVGVARTKTLAKIANKLGKASKKAQGVLVLTDPKWIDIALERTDVEDVWGVGRRWAEKLRGCRIHTAKDLRDADEKMILKRFNVVLTRTVLELRGISCLPLLSGPPMSKSIRSSLSFGHLIEDYDELRQAISAYAAHSAHKMRMEGLACTSVAVGIETNPFLRDEPQYFNGMKLPLLCPTIDTSEIIKIAVLCLEQIYREGYRYKRGDVMVDGLIPASEMQWSLLDSHDPLETESLMAVMDVLNARYGPGTLRYGAEGFRKAWKMRQNYLSSVTGPGIGSEYQQTKKIVELGTAVQLVRAL
ncbi:Y-family DNA polymerase [Vampirovibrio chlorellavorus]|uniref:Y-family DNA polymerase n=1 Tax=Vampirovibrio chlorellavorus TaxID=758823 RepID=UPI0026EC6FD3|nr:Y-family DNA polymerase [Vampirovibrio chlorellavorus]